MLGNGDPEDRLEEILKKLRFPDTFSDGERETRKMMIREEPEILEHLIVVGDLYEFILGIPGVLELTKQQMIKGLRHYLDGQETVYAVLVGMYVRELAAAIPKVSRDRSGCEKIRGRVLNDYQTFCIPSDTTIH